MTNRELCLWLTDRICLDKEQHLFTTWLAVWKDWGQDIKQGVYT